MDLLTTQVAAAGATKDNLISHKLDALRGVQESPIRINKEVWRKGNE